MARLPEVIDIGRTNRAPSAKDGALFFCRKSLARQLNKMAEAFGDKMRDILDKIIQDNPHRNITGGDFTVIRDYMTGKCVIATENPLPGSKPVIGERRGKIQVRKIRVKKHTVPEHECTRLTTRGDEATLKEYKLIQETLENVPRNQYKGMANRLNKVIAANTSKGKKKVNAVTHCRVMKALKKSRAR
jgi:hypothetical protein